MPGKSKKRKKEGERENKGAVSLVTNVLFRFDEKTSKKRRERRRKRRKKKRSA